MLYSIISLLVIVQHSKLLAIVHDDTHTSSYETTCVTAAPWLSKLDLPYHTTHPDSLLLYHLLTLGLYTYCYCTCYHFKPSVFALAFPFFNASPCISLLQCVNVQQAVLCQIKTWTPAALLHFLLGRDFHWNHFEPHICVCIYLCVTNLRESKGRLGTIYHLLAVVKGVFFSCQYRGRWTFWKLISSQIFLSIVRMGRGLNEKLFIYDGNCWQIRTKHT